MFRAECAICQEYYTSCADCILAALPCGHVFHRDCVKKWLQSNGTCPHCRNAVKRMNKVVRLFFDTTNSQIEHSQSHQSTPNLQNELSSIQNAYGRLEDRAREFEEEAKNNLKLASEAQHRASVMTARYEETQRHHEIERRRCHELRTELVAMRKLLQQAEALKEETISLRNEMEELRSVKKLIGSSESSAQEILSRYSMKIDISDMRSLCRLTAVLRSELTDARAKCRNYRDELSSLRKHQVVMAKRLADVEAKSTAKDVVIVDLRREVARSSCLSSDSPSPVRTVSSGTPATTNASPDLLAITPANGPSTEQLKKRLRTPSGNPFRLHLDLDDVDPAEDSRTSLSSTPSLPACSRSLSRFCRNVNRQNHVVSHQGASLLSQMTIMQRHSHSVRTDSSFHGLGLTDKGVNRHHRMSAIAKNKLIRSITERSVKVSQLTTISNS